MDDVSNQEHRFLPVGTAAERMKRILAGKARPTQSQPEGRAPTDSCFSQRIS